jgi:hypothetical protein
MFLGFEKRFNKQIDGTPEDPNAFRMAGRLKTGKGVILDFTAFPDNKQLVELEEKDNGYWHSLVDFEFEKKELAEMFKSLLDADQWISGIARTSLQLLGEEPQQKKGLFRR